MTTETKATLEVGISLDRWRSVGRVEPDRIEIVRDAARLMTLALGPAYPFRLVNDDGATLDCTDPLAVWTPPT